MNWRSLSINLNTHTPHRKFQSSIILPLWVGWYWEGDVFCYTIIPHGGAGSYSVVPVFFSCSIMLQT